MGETRLPRNGKEGFVYGLIICAITVTIMMTVNVWAGAGTMNSEIFLSMLKTWPMCLVVAMLVETFIVGKITNILLSKFTMPTDCFNARILFNILFCVTGMSMIMTIVGSMIGTGKISLDQFIHFPTTWPRNFCIAFWCEILIAQPIARFAMKRWHNVQSNKEDIQLNSETISTI